MDCRPLGLLGACSMTGDDDVAAALFDTLEASSWIALLAADATQLLAGYYDNGDGHIASAVYLRTADGDQVVWLLAHRFQSGPLL